MSLPRQLSLNEDDSLKITPIQELNHLRQEYAAFPTTKVAANETIILDGIEGKSIEIKAEVDPGSASECGFDVFRSDDGIEKTRISFIRTKTRFNPSDTLQIDISGSSLHEDKISSPPESGPFILEETETLKLRIFIDRSIVEVFANDKQCLTIRSYPTLPTSKKVAFFSLNGSSELIALEKEFVLTTERMINHYKKCTGLSETKIRQYLLPATDVWLSAKEAKKLGICDKIKDFK